jgi:4-nitrophenyl phosphatase
MVNALAWPAEQYPKVLGKPNTTGLELITKQCGRKVEECLMIGDRLETDIAVGNNFSNLYKNSL